MEIDIATIEKGSDYLGMVASIPPEDQFTRWRSEFESDILVSLASLAGERMFFDGDSSSGRVRRPRVGDPGGLVHGGLLGDGLDRLVVLDRAAAAGRQPGRRPGKREGEKPEAMLRRALADRIEDKLGDLLARAEAILTENRPRCSRWRTRWRSTGRSPATTSRRSSRAARARPWTAARTGTPEFAARLEDYHAAAVGAHHGHSRMPIALPPGRSTVDGPAEGTAAATA